MSRTVKTEAISWLKTILLAAILAAAVNSRPVQVVINYTGSLAALGEILAPQINISNQRMGGSMA